MCRPEVSRPEQSLGGTGRICRPELSRPEQSLSGTGRMCCPELSRPEQSLSGSKRMCRPELTWMLESSLQPWMMLENKLQSLNDALPYREVSPVCCKLPSLALELLVLSCVRPYLVTSSLLQVPSGSDKAAVQNKCLSWVLVWHLGAARWLRTSGTP